MTEQTLELSAHLTSYISLPRCLTDYICDHVDG
jgi:hypothetical protein